MVVFSLRVLSTRNEEVVVVSSYFETEIWILVLLFVVLSFGRIGFDVVHVFDCNSCLIVIPYLRKVVPPVRWAGVPARDSENSKRESRDLGMFGTVFTRLVGCTKIDCKPPTWFGGNIDVWLASFLEYSGNCSLQGLGLVSVEQFALLVLMNEI